MSLRMARRCLAASLIACGMVGVLLVPVGVLRLLMVLGAPDFAAALGMVLAYAVLTAVAFTLAFSDA